VNPGLPESIRDRTPAPHALKVGLRTGRFPSVDELAGFCGTDAGAIESGDGWIRVSFARDTVLVLAEEGVEAMRAGFDHGLRVESSRSKLCFLAAYFVARRMGGVVQVRNRSVVLPAAAFADRFLDGEDLEARWTRAVPGA
jgi:hypothetical protein